MVVTIGKLDGNADTFKPIFSGGTVDFAVLL